MPNNDYFYHHGIDGQKWGKRNGPPYPLNRDSIGSVIKKKKKSNGGNQTHNNKPTMSRDEAKAKALNSGKAKEVLKYRDELTNKELNDALNRIKWYMSLDMYNDQQTKSAFKTIDAYMTKLSTITKWAETLTRVYKLLPADMKKPKKK